MPIQLFPSNLTQSCVASLENFKAFDASWRQGIEGVLHHLNFNPALPVLDTFYIHLG